MSRLGKLIEQQAKRNAFVSDIAHVINCYSRENKSDTPDFILAEYVVDALEAYEQAARKRTEWGSVPKHEELIAPKGPE